VKLHALAWLVEPTSPARQANQAEILVLTSNTHSIYKNKKFKFLSHLCKYV